MRLLAVGAVFVAAAWAGAFGIAFGVVEWRDDGGPTVTESLDTERCQAAVAFFTAIDAFISDTERVGLTGALLEDTTIKDAWNEAFVNMNEECLYVR